jgi:hypothetical protein
LVEGQAGRVLIGSAFILIGDLTNPGVHLHVVLKYVKRHDVDSS